MPNILDPEDNPNALSLEKLRKEFGIEEQTIEDEAKAYSSYQKNVNYLEQMLLLPCDQLNPRLVEELENENC
jgi:hypothetical protein